MDVFQVIKVDLATMVGLVEINIHNKAYTINLEQVQEVFHFNKEVSMVHRMELTLILAMAVVLAVVTVLTFKVIHSAVLLMAMEEAATSSLSTTQQVKIHPEPLEIRKRSRSRQNENHEILMKDVTQYG